MRKQGHGDDEGRETNHTRALGFSAQGKDNLCRALSNMLQCLTRSDWLQSYQRNCSLYTNIYKRYQDLPCWHSQYSFWAFYVCGCAISIVTAFEENQELHYGIYHIYENLRPNFLYLTTITKHSAPGSKYWLEHLKFIIHQGGKKRGREQFSLPNGIVAL